MFGAGCIGVVVCTLGECASLVLPLCSWRIVVSGCVVVVMWSLITLGDEADSWRSCWRRLRSSSFVWLRCWAWMLFCRILARLEAAATIASAGVMHDVVMYLCLKNTVPVMCVVHVVFVQIVQQQ